MLVGLAVIAVSAGRLKLGLSELPFAYFAAHDAVRRMNRLSTIDWLQHATGVWFIVCLVGADALLRGSARHSLPVIVGVALAAVLPGAICHLSRRLADRGSKPLSCAS